MILWADIPAQVLAPPGFKIDIPKVARVKKFSREERKEYKLKQQAGKVKDPHKKKVKAQAKIPAVVVNSPAAGAKKELVLRICYIRRIQLSSVPHVQNLTRSSVNSVIECT
jgi:hypothetical protein